MSKSKSQVREIASDIEILRSSAHEAIERMLSCNEDIDVELHAAYAGRALALLEAVELLSGTGKHHAYDTACIEYSRIEKMLKG